MQQARIAVIVSTYQRPFHLRRSILSLTQQSIPHCDMEVVVTDDGSTDDTEAVVRQLASEVDFSLAYTTEKHAGFRLARCRNRAVRLCSAPYLLFTDGDCLLPPDHLQVHLESQEVGRVVGGECWRLSQFVSDQIDEQSVLDGSFLQRTPQNETRRLVWKGRRAKVYSWLRIALLPRLTGCNIGVWRSDFERVNGFDENYVGWGLEDTDFQRRLHQIGVGIKSIVSETAVCHLWHPPHPTFSRNGLGTPNLEYFERVDLPGYCTNGFRKSDESKRAI